MKNCFVKDLANLTHNYDYNFKPRKYMGQL